MSDWIFYVFYFEEFYPIPFEYFSYEIESEKYHWKKIKIVRNSDEFDMDNCKDNNQICHPMESLPVFSEFLHRPITRCQRQWDRERKSKKSKSEITQKSTLPPEARIEYLTRISTNISSSMDKCEGPHEDTEFLAKWEYLSRDMESKNSSEYWYPENYPKYEYCLFSALFCRIRIKKESERCK